LKLNYDKLLSNCAFNLNLRHYTETKKEAAAAAALAAEREGLEKLELDILHAESQRALEEAAAAVTARFRAAIDAGNGALIVAVRSEKAAAAPRPSAAPAASSPAVAIAAAKAAAEAVMEQCAMALAAHDTYAAMVGWCRSNRVFRSHQTQM